MGALFVRAINILNTYYMGILNGRVVIVTGETTLVETTFIQKLLIEGGKVVITGLSDKAAEELIMQQNSNLIIWTNTLINEKEVRECIDFTLKCFEKIDIVIQDPNRIRLDPVIQTQTFESLHESLKWSVDDLVRLSLPHIEENNGYFIKADPDSAHLYIAHRQDSKEKLAIQYLFKDVVASREPISNANGKPNSLQLKNGIGPSKNGSSYKLNDVEELIKGSENFSIKVKDILCFSHLRWDFVFQRPQHLLSRFTGEYRVFFVEEPIFDALTKNHLKINISKEGVFLVTPHVKKGLSFEETEDTLRELVNSLLLEKNINNYISWYITPMAYPYTNQLSPRLLVYDCMDELSHFLNAPKEMLENEEVLLKNADIVFTGGFSLYEYKKHQHHNIHPFPSSIDKAHFSSGLGKADPTDQQAIPHPRIGFFGVVDERFDRDLLEGISKAKPEFQFIIIGPVVKIDPENLPKADNIHYLGPKDYAELPQYLAHWDVAFLPFAKNNSTKFISPTKTPEYLCAFKPVVSTSITDVVNPYGKEGLVHIADSVDDFILSIQSALDQETDIVWKKKVKEFLHELSWDKTWSEMEKLIYATLTDKTPTISKNGNDDLDRINAKAGRHLMFDYVIVGAGFAGSVLAERLANESNKRVLVVDKRNHIAGNAYDCYDDSGILIHKYGPHIFHTNSRDVFDYLSRFTTWRDYEHRVKGSVNGMLVPIPINLDTINLLYGYNFNSNEVEEFLSSVAEPRDKILTSEDVVISKVGKELYEKFFKGYTKKQWGIDPSELNASVTSRVPIRTNRDDRYFTDSFQAMPQHGYTRMFQNMLAHPNINVMLNTDFKDIQHLIPYREIIYTGPIDEFFDFRFGKLPYRSLDFVFKTFDKEIHQPTGTINYPNEHLYTRVTEFKYLTGQVNHKTSIVYEYPKAEGDPYYPVPRKENTELYNKYEKLAKETAQDVHFVGRLATYKYYNMDQVVAQALATFKKIANSQQQKIEHPAFQYS